VGLDPARVTSPLPARHRSRRWVGIAVTLLLVAAVIGATTGIGRPQELSPVKATTPTFRVKGSVRGLYPGSRTVLRARVTNPYPVPIVVRKVQASVRSTTAPCPKGVIKIRRWKGRKVLRAHAVGRVTLRVRMRRSAADACQGVRFQLAFSGSASRP
jgi:hypothetical protein